MCVYLYHTYISHNEGKKSGSGIWAQRNLFPQSHHNQRRAPDLFAIDPSTKCIQKLSLLMKMTNTGQCFVLYVEYQYELDSCL